MGAAATSTPRPLGSPIATRSFARTAFLLAVLLLVLRLPTLRHPWPTHEDEVEFVAAIGFPSPYPVHHPGYPLWVALGTVASRLGAEPYAAYQFWSLIASCIGPALFAIGLHPLVGGVLAWWGGFALGVSPLWAFHGAAALNYPLAACLALSIAGLCWSVRRKGGATPLYLAAGLLAVGIGLRSDLLVWMGPLLLCTALRRGRQPALICALLLGAAALLWGIFTSMLYRAPGSPDLVHTREIVCSTSIFVRGPIDGAVRNTVKLSAYLGWTLGLAAIPLACAGVVRFRPIATAFPGAWTFLILWLAPVLLFQVLIHVTEAGHAIWYLPPVYSMLVLGVATLRPRKSGLAVLVLVSLASLAQFFAYPWNAEVAGWRRVLNAKVAFLSARGLAHIDQRARIHQPNDFWPVGRPGGVAPGPDINR